MSCVPIQYAILAPLTQLLDVTQVERPPANFERNKDYKKNINCKEARYLLVCYMFFYFLRTHFVRNLELVPPKIKNLLKLQKSFADLK